MQLWYALLAVQSVYPLLRIRSWRRKKSECAQTKWMLARRRGTCLTSDFMPHLRLSVLAMVLTTAPLMGSLLSVARTSTEALGSPAALMRRSDCRLMTDASAMPSGWLMAGLHASRLGMAIAKAGIPAHVSELTARRYVGSKLSTSMALC